MFLSKKCTYGIQAMIYLALAAGNPYVSIREIADNLQISFHFLTKILQELAKHKLVTTYRGPSGGAQLARDPEEITVEDIIIALDGEDLFRQCILGFAGCGKNQPCPFHARYAEFRDQLRAMFRSITIAELKNDVEKNNARLSSPREKP